MELVLRVKISVDDNVGKAFKAIISSKDMKAIFFEKLFERFSADTVKESELNIISFMLESKQQNRITSNTVTKKPSDKPAIEKKITNDDKQQKKKQDIIDIKTQETQVEQKEYKNQKKVNDVNAENATSTSNTNTDLQGLKNKFSEMKSLY